MSLSLSFPDQTYSSSNKPSDVTLKSDLSAIEVAFNALPSATETLTNKTLTNPVINYTDTAMSMNVKASAYASAAQTITLANTWYKIALDSERYDAGGDFNTTTYLFTCPVTGYYFVSGHVKMSLLSANHRLSTGIAVNTAIVLYGSDVQATGGSSYLASTVSGVIYCASGNTIELDVTCTEAGKATQFDAAGLGLYLHIHLLSI